MAGITLDQANTMLTALIAAQTAIANGAQSYSVAGRAMSRANLNEIGEQIKYYQALVNRLSRVGGVRIRRAIPL